MTIWLTDDEGLSGPAATSPPTPAETPFRTPSRPPKMTRRSVTPPPKGPTPPPGEAERQEKVAKRSSRDVNKDETISPLDPRRFTPTLHANLVSEILTLRRDQEDKTKIIESLEIALTSSREDQESLRENLSVTAKENRSTKRQLALLEGGTSSALGELARERDDAVEQASDVKKRLEAAQKKLRVQEDDSQRVHDLWAKEKDAWEDEKRKFERKIHIAETRLKAVLDEVAAFQAAQAGAQNGHESDPESMRDTDVGSVRSMSIANSARYSTNFTDNRANGNTLADELDFEGDDDYDTDLDGRESVLSRRTSLRHTRNFSRDSVINRFHRKNKSIDSISRRGSLRGTMLVNYSLTETLEPDEDAKTEIPSVEYEDRGVQCSPPSSPEPSIAVPSTPELAPSRIVPLDEETTPRKEGEYEANQRRKRVQVSPLVIGEAAKDIAEEAVQEPQIPSIPMVSIACQTVEEPVSPPKTPPPEITLPEMVTSCTQTDEPSSPVLPPLPLPIPSISIQPPTSRPTTPREPRLPPNSKHFGCQVNISWTVSNSDASIQTEGIQVDKRIAQLPRHLQPSSVTSRPNSPIPPPSDNLDKDFNLPPAPELPSKSPRRFTQQSVNSYMPPSPVTARHPIDTEELHLHDAYPGNNDDGPLSSQKDAPIKRPQRFSSLFAGFDTASSDDGDDFGVEASDSEYQTPLSARPPFMSDQLRKRGSSSTGAMSPEPSEQVIRQGPARSLAKPLGSETYSSFSMVEEEPESPRTAETTSPKPHERASPSSSRKMGAIRKTALIQSGIASHNGRPRSPSVPEGRNPPFPIPTRASSRRPPASSSAPSEPPSPTRMDHWPSRGPRNAYRTNSIRKVRSAAALARKEHTRKQSRSPPPLSPSSGVPESPAYPPPLPRNELTTPRGRRSNPYKRNRRRPSTNTERTDAASANDQAHTAGVVDAIAQTMVGEWMFKYVRRRKSFTVNESNNKDDTGNERHKRWVWLAPYERAILWSSKQPNSGTALMGKAGRKLTIQSVLDVKDDNPTPRGATSVFDRSILILTPQRALKFTASTSERHYIWLTALSFLAHSQQTVPEILSPAAPPSKVQSPPDGEPIQKPRGRRPGIRDSIRLAKGRSPASSAKAGTPSVPSIPSAPASHAGEPANFLIPESIGAISSSHVRDESEDIAVPPMVPRFNERGDRNAVHGRKRSNTGGHVPPPLSFRGFSNPPSNHRATGSTADASIMTAGSSDFYQYQGSAGPGWGTDSQWSASQPSHRPSEASSRPGNFFDAIGTVRMEAFISPLSDLPSEAREYGHVGRRRSKDARRRRSRSRQRDSYSYRSRASEDRYGGNRTAGEEDFFRDDPFRGF